MKQTENKEKVREVFTDHLPRWDKGNNKGMISWIKSAEIKSKVKFQYDDLKGEVEIVDYKNGFLYVNYLNKKFFKIWTSDFKECHITKLLNKRTSDFKIEIGKVFKDDKRCLTVLDREYRPKYRENGTLIQNRKYYKYKCNKCGWNEGWISENNLKQGQGCSCCCSSPQIVVPGINDIPTTAPWMIPYFQGGHDEAKLYSKNSNKKFIPICPDCGRIKDRTVNINNLYANHSINCSCSDGISYCEKFIYNLIEMLNIDFKAQLSIVDYKWCGNNRYDFYIPYINTIIEANGEQHYSEISNFSTIKGKRKARTLKEEQENDRLKKELALANGIKEENYIVIDCRKSELEFIKSNILNSRLAELFDLNNIDWNEVQEFALSNLVKKTCELKKDNPDFTANDIGKIMKLSGTTIIKYLKKGTGLGWCEYDAKKEKLRGIEKAKKVNQLNTKKVEIFNKENVSLGIFNNSINLEKQSEKLLGIKLNHKNISAVCLGKVKTHKGFTFRYISKEQYKI